MQEAERLESELLKRRDKVTNLPIICSAGITSHTSVIQQHSQATDVELRNPAGDEHSTASDNVCGSFPLPMMRTLNHTDLYLCSAQELLI